MRSRARSTNGTLCTAMPALIMDLPFLHRGGGQLGLALAFRHFRPTQAANFVTPLTSEDQQFDDPTVVIVQAGVPDRDQLRPAQGACAGAVLGPCADVERRVDIEVAAVDCPGKEPGQRRPGAIRSY